MAALPSDPLGRHDWYSVEYVRRWVAKDRERSRDFAPIVQLLRPRARRHVLDVGGGYGRLTRAVLDACPHSEVVLQDFSRPMLEHARMYLRDYADRYEAVEADLRDSSWPMVVGGPFDAAVSAIAIHNLRETSVMERVYFDILGLLRPNGLLVEVDHLGPEETLDRRRGLVARAGFVDVQVGVQDNGDVLVRGRRA